MKKVLLTLVFVTGCIAAMAQWSDNPEENNRITPTDMNLYETVFKVTPDGLTYFVFSRPSGGNIITCLQIIDKDGKMLFPEEGKVISRELTRTYTVINDLIMIDKDNNAIIAVHDCRNSSSELKKVSYSIYKVSPTGEMLWGDQGIDLNQGHSYDVQADIKMIQLEDGSYVFAWMAGTNELLRIEMQRLSSDGEFLWDQNLALKDDVVKYSYPRLTNAGNNQFNLVYAKGSNKDIMVRKLDFDGSSVWPEDVRVYRGGFPDIPLQVILKVLPDPNGGVFVGWYDDRGFTNKESTFVSYVKPNGTLAFASGEQGERVGYSELRSFTPDMIYDQTENCLYVVWRETSSSQSYQRIVAQKIAMTGELKWGPEGIEVAPLTTAAAGYYSVQDAGPGQMTAFYMLQHAAGFGDVKAYAVRLDKDGNFVWGEEPLTLASCTSEKNSLESSQLINNSYWLTMWSDQRRFTTDPGEKYVEKVYMQKVNIDGTFGATSVSSAKTEYSSLSANPTIVQESTQFAFNNEKQGTVDLSIHSLSGEKLAIVCHQTMEQGTFEISWNPQSNHIATGMYIATLTTASGVQSIRIIVK